MGPTTFRQTNHMSPRHQQEKETTFRPSLILGHKKDTIFYRRKFNVHFLQLEFLDFVKGKKIEKLREGKKKGEKF